MREAEAWDSILQEPLPEGAQQYFETLATKIRAEIERVGATEVAEFGCGRGELIGTLARALPDSHFIGYDLSPMAISRLRKNALPNQEFEVASLPQVPARTFDCVLCINTLHYVPESLLATRRLWSIVRPGGVLVFNYPNRYYLAALPPEPQDHTWAVVERPMRLKKNLLTRKRIQGSIHGARWRVIHRSRGKIIYLCAEKVE